MRPSASVLAAAFCALAFPALAGALPRSTPRAASVPVQLAQACNCQNPVGAIGETQCRRQRVVRCRVNTRNQCSWEETNDRC